MITTRVATLADLTRLVIYGRQAHAASNYSDIPFNPRVTRETFRSAILGKGQDVLVAERADGSLCGFVICLTAPLPFSVRKYATDVDLYAEQGGDKLLDAFIAWAKTHHAARIDCGVTQEDENGRIDVLYRRKGMRRCGGMYMLKLENQP